MTVIERARVPKSITRTYCAKPDCDGEGFYSARCQSAGHATEDVEYVPAEQLAGAVEAERQRMVDLIQEAAAEHPDPSRARKALLSVAIDIALSDTDGWW
jgi:hypothetical protein